MPLDIELYKNRLEAYKIDTKDGRIENLKQQIIKDFKTNPSYFQVEINNALRDIIITDKSSLNIKPDEKLIIAKPNEEINIGDIVNWNTEYWLCIDSEHDKTVYSKGIIKYCNNILKWQDEDLELQEIPCIIEDKTSVYSDGVNENKYLSIAENQILVTVPKTQVTEKLGLNKRFIFNHSEYYVFKLTKIDEITQPGLLKFTMTKDSVSANDNLEKNIADYVDTQQQTGSGYEIVIRGDSLLYYGNTKTYTATVYLDGVEVTEDVSWSLSNENASIISQDGQSVTIKGDVSNSNVTLTAILIVDNNITATKEITIGGLF